MSVASLPRRQRTEAYDSGWHYVGDPGEPAFLNSWENYGTWGDAAFRRIGNTVYLSGLIRNGSADTTFFILPIGYRISSTMNGSNYIYQALDDAGENTNARINISTAGNVSQGTGSTAWVSLNGILFLTDDPTP